MSYIDFLSSVHKSTKRDYLARVNDPEYPKAYAATLAKKWDFDYWDGSRKVNYGGYSYDGRWTKVAKAMVEHYGIKAGDKILDIGCGKGFLLYDFMQVCPGVEVAGIDISSYAIENSLPEIRDRVSIGNAKNYLLKPMNLISYYPLRRSTICMHKNCFRRCKKWNELARTKNTCVLSLTETSKKKRTYFIGKSPVKPLTPLKSGTGGLS